MGSHRILSLVAVALTTALGLAACGRRADEMKNAAQDAQRAAQEALEAGGAWSREKWNDLRDVAFEKKAQFLDAARPMWERSKVELENARQKAAEKGSDAVEELKKQQEVLRQKWEAVQGAGEDGWEDAKKSFGTALEKAKEKWADWTR
jgi:hypothetical protein